MFEDQNHWRRIRSFVKREGRLTVAQQRALAELWPQFGLHVAEGVLDLSAVFAREAPTVLEIGFGNGETLLQMAQAETDKNFIGVDVHRPGVGSLLLGIETHQLKNVRVFAEDAVEVLTHCLPVHSLHRVQIFFPDPWPKKRHHKRRLIQTAFLDLLRDRMHTGAILHVATDWENYAEHITEVVSAHPGFSAIDRPAGHPKRPLSKFERRGLAKGHGVWDVFFQASDSPQPSDNMI